MLLGIDKFNLSKCSEMNGRSKAAPPPPHRPVPVIPPSVKPRVIAVETTTPEKFSDGSKPKAKPRLRNDTSSVNATQG